MIEIMHLNRIIKLTRKYKQLRTDLNTLLFEGNRIEYVNKLIEFSKVKEQLQTSAVTSY